MMDASEQHRHRCETRHLIRQVSERGREWVRQYLDDKRVAGRQARLRADLIDILPALKDGDSHYWRHMPVPGKDI